MSADSTANRIAKRRRAADKVLEEERLVVGVLHLSGQRSEQRSHLVIHLRAFREGGDELGFDVLTEAMTHAAERLAQGGWAFAEALGEGSEIAVLGFAADERLEAGEEVGFAGRLPLGG